MSIHYLTGDATDPPRHEPVIVAHVVNNRGGWGAGFVLAVSKRWPLAEVAYRSVAAAKGLRLGENQFVPVEPDHDGKRAVCVCNMIAQDGFGEDGRPPIRYDALHECLSNLICVARSLGASIHMPRIGCGLAGGSWPVIQSLINTTLVAAGIDVFVYDLPASDSKTKGTR